MVSNSQKKAIIAKERKRAQLRNEYETKRQRAAALYHSERLADYRELHGM